MIFFGTRCSQKTTPVNSSCPSCNDEYSMEAIRFQRYFHIFWIPIWPTSRKHFCVCKSCGASWELDNSNVESVTGTKSGTPVWTFLGLLAVPIFMVSALIGGKIEDNNSANWITDPLVGDVYEYRTDDSLFSLLKAYEVSEDTVYLYQHQNSVKKSHHIHRLHSLKGTDDQLYYTAKEDAYPVSKPELVEMKKEGIIQRVKRD